MKKLVEWKDSYCIKISEIDEQHRKLFDILNQLYDSFLNGNTGSDIDLILDELEDYTIYHFEEEEKLFAKFNYSQTEEHVNQHESFISKIDEFKEKINSKNSKVHLELINFLRDWIIKHILFSDKLYVNELK